MLCYTCVMCPVMLYKIGYVCNIRYVMLYNMCLIFYNMGHVVLCYMCLVMLCNISYVNLYNMCHVMFYNMGQFVLYNISRIVLYLMLCYVI